MDLSKHRQQKRKSTIVLALLVLLTIVLIFQIRKNREEKSKVSENKQVSSIIITHFSKNKSYSYPLLLMKDSIVLHIFTSNIPADTSFSAQLNPGKHIFYLVDSAYRKIAIDSSYVSNSDVIFLNL